MNKSVGTSASVSPLTTRTKHSTTPVRSKCRTSRRELGINKHAACSTPNTKRMADLNSLMSSPVSYSQGSPDVVWDFNSPKPVKGTKRKEINITIEEFLKNLNQQKISECNSQSSNYIKLLEKWMTHQKSTTVAKKTLKVVKNENKKRSKKVLSEIKEFMDSIKNKNLESNKKKEASENMATENLRTKEMLNISSTSFCLDKKSFIEGNSECDSSDELWGDLDNSFMIKATQVLEETNLACTNTNLDFVSVIPETVSSSNESNCSPCVLNQNNDIVEKPNCNKVPQIEKDLELQTEFILTQLLNCDWDSDSDNDWDNGFILEDDDLSQIPDDVLSGNTLIKKKSSDESSSEQTKETVSSSETHDVLMKDGLFDDEVNKMFDNSELNDNATVSIPLSEQNQNNSGELFNNFDANFGDESILCKPEVLSWIDEVENNLTQKCSPEHPKCTPEEIEKKKDEALRRRRGKRSTVKK